MYDDYYTPTPDEFRYSDRRRYDDSRRYPSEDRRRYVDSRLSDMYDDHPNEYRARGRPPRYDDDLRTPPPDHPNYVKGSRHHGYPKHVFTGQRVDGDKNYYFTRNDGNKEVPQDDRKLREYRITRPGHRTDYYPDDVNVNSAYDDDPDYYERSRRKIIKGHRVHVVVEHWRGVIGKGVYNDLKNTTHDLYDEREVTFEERKGLIDTFEVYINDRLMYSRSRNGGYPNIYDFLEEVKRARHGGLARRIRNDSRTCTIL